MSKAEPNPKARILYVDDDLENLSSFKAMFRREYEVHTAATPKEGLDILRSRDIQVLITDQRMPEMNGTDLLEIVADEFPKTRRFLLTAFSDFPPLVEAINKGRLQGYFSKPIDGDFIRSRIEDGLKNYYLEQKNRKLLETVKQSEGFLSAIFENIPDIVFVKDARDCRYLKLNRSGEEILGIKREEIEGKNADEILEEPLKSLFSHLDDDVVKQKKALDIPEDIVPTRSKGKRLFHTKKIPITDSEGNPLYILGVSRDITEKKEFEKKQKILEEKLRHIEKMKSIGTLAGGIAHDFNNILSSIIGYTELSMMDVDLGRSPLRHLKEIYTGGKRARDLVKQILTFARQSEDKIVPVQVDIIAREVMKLIRSTIPSSIQIKQNIESGLRVMGSPTHFHQVLMNLCTNAAQAMEITGGELFVSITRVAPEDARSGSENGVSGEKIRFVISDTGCGISADIKDLIFEPYFSTKGPSEGTGMGLATVYGIVKSLEGTISFTSEPGKGSVFTLTFPACGETRETQEEKTAALPTGNERILVVDDEEPIVKIMGETLEFLGYTPTVMTDSLKSLELFKASPDRFDLVVTDMTMPGMTGDDLARKIMEIRPKMPVILCTGYSRKISEEQAKFMGLKAFLYKPVTMKDLARTIRDTLDNIKKD